MGFLIAQNYYLYTRLWSVFRRKLEGKYNLFTIGVDGRSLEAIKKKNLHTNLTTFLCMASRGKILGEKPMDFPEGISKP